jgi:hypothetical protein
MNDMHVVALREMEMMERERDLVKEKELEHCQDIVNHCSQSGETLTFKIRGIYLSALGTIIAAECCFFIILIIWASEILNDPAIWVSFVIILGILVGVLIYYSQLELQLSDDDLRYHSVTGTQVILWRDIEHIAITNRCHVPSYIVKNGTFPREFRSNYRYNTTNSTSKYLCIELVNGFHIHINDWKYLQPINCPPCDIATLLRAFADSGSSE